MPTIRIPPGIARGASKAEIPGRWYDAHMIRWANGVMRPVGGNARITAAPLPSIPRMGHVWQDINFERRAAYICDNKVYVEENSVWTDITPLAWADPSQDVGRRGYGAELYDVWDYGKDTNFTSTNPRVLEAWPLAYSMDNYDDELLFAQSVDGRVMRWNPNAAIPRPKPLAVPNAPTLIQSFLVTDEHHLMVFGPGGYPNRVAWSSQEDIEDWDFANPLNSAAWLDLQGAGNLIGATRVPGGILAYSQTQIWFGRYIGAPYFYKFEQIAEGVSTISAHAVAVAGSRAIWMSRAGFQRFEAGAVTPIMTELGGYPFDDLDLFSAPRRVTAGHNGLYPEIWWYFPVKSPQGGLQENSRYVAYNYVEGWWTLGYEGRTFYKGSPIDRFPVAGGADRNVYQHEQGWTDNGGVRLNGVWAQSGAMSFDDAERVYSTSQMQVEPNDENPQSVSFNFSGRLVRGGPIVDFGKRIAEPSGYLNARFSARDFFIKVMGEKDGPWAFGTLVVEVKPRGKR